MNQVMLVYGRSRSGKTRFTGTWPRPFVLADGYEGGHVTYQDMADEDLHEAGRQPIIREIYSAADYNKFFKEATDLAKSDKVKTIVVDSLTFYADQFVAAQVERGISGYELWGSLLNHLTFLRKQAHRLPCNVIWTALLKEDSDGKPLGPMIAGKSGDLFPAACPAVLYFEAKQRGSKIERIAHTQPYNGCIAGVKANSKMAPRLVNPTYKSFMEALNKR